MNPRTPVSNTSPGFSKNLQVCDTRAYRSLNWPTAFAPHQKRSTVEFGE